MIGSRRDLWLRHGWFGLALALVLAAPHVSAADDPTRQATATASDSATADDVGTPKVNTLPIHSQRSFSATRCRTVTRRPIRDIILGDPNGPAEGSSQGIHLSLGETLCITGTLESSGRLSRLVILRDEVPAGPVIALRMLGGHQGTDTDLRQMVAW